MMADDTIDADTANANRERQRAAVRRWRERHREELKHRENAKRLANLAEYNARKRAEYAARRERDPDAHFKRERERDRKWREGNVTYYEKHRNTDLQRRIVRGNEGRAARQSYINSRLKTDINFRLAYNIRKRLQVAMRRYKKGELAIVPRKLGCSIAELRLWLECQFAPGMTWDNYGANGWHIDHIRPLSLFDLRFPDQMAAACHYTNLQPLWAADNSRKSNKVITVIPPSP